MYFSPGFMWVFGDWFKDAEVWLAWYNKSITYQNILDKMAASKWRGKVRLWQYASDGDINNDGIADGLKLGMEAAALDLNVFLGTMQEWSAWAGSTPPPVTPPTEDPPVIPPVVVGKTKVIELKTVVSASGLNIRSQANTTSSILGWIANGKEIEILETIVSGANIWARVGQGQYCAVKYNGITYLA